ncbi:putative monooxygenase [Wickerhamomyces ciferrii]|uniref:Monooxygenase n=1 Tax=Wickerhamomyces ciferrii (strain ATCC 14091 / BCRC 22168 / CBS 111 / JCM 3599 / NBRC 0793 / NRRL Y-1031 F-60-10) TaxID=1206466 RepID=K0KPJ4_WICCF|nr:putative monooxygenase [Wickerhamomyces ciferrii]CCH43279.1 putative monooxygenase [Wickerhamomyces ciferrii]
MSEEPTLKKQKRQTPLILSASTRATAINWKDPEDTSREFSSSIEPWIKLAKLAESGKFHSIFFIDHLSWFDVYGSSHESSARTGINVSRIDPTAALSALSLVTDNIGFGVTVSSVSEHPYHFARRLSSLDILTNGRVGWNIVASYLPSVGPSLLNGEPLPEHDERYNKTQEFTDAVYSLLLSSWRDDALVYDKINKIYANPDAIRPIDHKGQYYNIQAPHITEPTRQRFPLIIQAGSSPRGKLFAAENAELIYIHNTAKTHDDIADIRHAAQKYFGRDPSSLKFIISVTVYVDKTHEDALKQEQLVKDLQDEESAFVYFGGKSNIDVKPFEYDEPITFKGKVNGVSETADNLTNSDKSKPNNSKRQLYETQLRKKSKYVGTASEVADLLEEAIKETGADGLNFQQTSFPSGLEQIVELLIPELQKRGLAQTEYTSQKGTFRENFFGNKGQTFVSKDHPVHDLRWESGVSKEEFEERLSKTIEIRNERRKTALETLEK